VSAIYTLLQKALGGFPDHARDWIAGPFIPTLLTIAIGVIAAKLIRRSLKAFLDKTRIRTDPLLTSFFLRAIYSMVLALSVITALKTAGVPIETFIAGLGITGILIGFGLRDTLSNLAAGLFLLIYRPFRAGDTIEIEGSRGVVNELTIVNMQMTTTDGVTVIMPNSKVWGSKITNYSMAQQRRIEIIVKLARRDARRAIEIITPILEADDRVLKAPQPAVSVSSLAENAAALTVWAWTKPADFQPVINDQYLKILTALDQAHIDTF
jgi:small conductance mechanosensitive channel